ncbi:hypothetical protein Y958_28395 [Nitrospirillum viridazoti CBAmc]|uniref:Uncharacterized protein n=1 Tax=Nitrospirillum viridazoti CBAmc TaxID=1441467 RepID=A0A248K1V3_9PROT|nr:hypothetical protein Y958_28395 [Nitrospirillum amazonense CBAmc]
MSRVCPLGAPLVMAAGRSAIASTTGIEDEKDALVLYELHQAGRRIVRLVRQALQRGERGCPQ